MAYGEILQVSPLTSLVLCVCFSGTQVKESAEHDSGGWEKDCTQVWDFGGKPSAQHQVVQERERTHRQKQTQKHKDKKKETVSSYYLNVSLFCSSWRKVLLQRILSQKFTGTDICPVRSMWAGICQSLTHYNPNRPELRFSFLIKFLTMQDSVTVLRSITQILASCLICC